MSYQCVRASLVAQLIKNPPAMQKTWVRDLGSIPGLGRSLGEGKVYPLQYPGLENPMGCIVLGVAKSRSELSDFHFHFHSQFTKQENDSLEMFTQHKPVRARGGLHGLFSGCWILNCLSSLIVSTRWPRSKGV